MKKTIRISCVALILAANAHASSYNVDVYGVDDETGGKIINCCAEKIGRYEDLKEKFLIKQSKAMTPPLTIQSSKKPGTL